MELESWQKVFLDPGNEDLLWELFHENSKIGEYHVGLSDQEVRARMNELFESLPFEGYQVVKLPESLAPLKYSLQEAISNRSSQRQLQPCTLSLKTLATLLHYAYGVTRDNKNTSYPRPFRVVPSGGALYPLEIFFHSSHLTNLSPGLYHYNPSQNCLRRIQEGNNTQHISTTIVQPELAINATLIIFLTAIFERSVFKYGDRGYRFTLLEAGHVAQNLNLVATALGLASVNIGGFF